MPLIIVKQAGSHSLPEVTGSHGGEGRREKERLRFGHNVQPEDLSHDCRKGPELSHNDS